METLTVCKEDMEKSKHYPVMYREVIRLLDIPNKRTIIDCTLGVGSHALKFLSTMRKDALLIGIDKDEESLKVASQRLKSFSGRFRLIKGDFSQIDKILDELNIPQADILFFDLGLSTYQMQQAERGFSFLKDGPLDMRLDRSSFLSAYDLINNLSEKELTLIFVKFGEERYARRIARFLVASRKREPISTTAQAVNVIIKAVGNKYLNQRIHPATRTFQALRIAVNRELELQERALNKVPSLLAKGGRAGVISFHSLEDRITKHMFRSFSSQGILRVITKKPISPAQEEKRENPSSRSAKLRVAERI